MMIGTISTILAATIINVAFPALMVEFHVGHDTLQWIAAGFLAATTATMLATAWLVETIGERATFIATMTLFLAASLLAAISWSAQSLITARIVQGACAGILQPLAMIVLFRVYPVEERGRAMALYGFGIVLAPAIGPAIGGALLEAFGWRSIFLLTVPFCIAGIALGATTLPRHAGRTSSRFDWVGWGLLLGALIALLNVPVEGHRDGLTAPLTIVLALAGCALAAAYGYGFATAHGYSDGNKRIAFVAMYTFLGVNGLEIVAPEPQVVRLMIDVASGACDEAQLAAWLRQHVEPFAG